MGSVEKSFFYPFFEVLAVSRFNQCICYDTFQLNEKKSAAGNLLLSFLSITVTKNKRSICMKFQAQRNEVMFRWIRFKCQLTLSFVSFFCFENAIVACTICTFHTRTDTMQSLLVPINDCNLYNHYVRMLLWAMERVECRFQLALPKF